VASQGGDPSVVDDLSLLPQAPIVMTIPSPRAGYLRGIDAREIGLASVALGAGRERKGDAIDPAVGVVLCAKVGQQVAEGDPLFVVHARQQADAQAARERILAGYTYSPQAVNAPPLFHGILRG
jgi:thymidine phosphorylase